MAEGRVVDAARSLPVLPASIAAATAGNGRGNGHNANGHDHAAVEAGSHAQLGPGGQAPPP